MGYNQPSEKEVRCLNCGEYFLIIGGVEPVVIDEEDFICTKCEAKEAQIEFEEDLENEMRMEALEVESELDNTRAPEDFIREKEEG